MWGREMTVSGCFAPTVSLYHHEFFNELMDANVVAIHSIGEMTAGERHLLDNVILEGRPGFRVIPLVWAIEQVKNFCELCSEGRIRFDFREQGHVELFLRMARGMKECLAHEKGEVYEILLGLFKYILLWIRHYCTLPDMPVPFDIKTMSFL